MINFLVITKNTKIGKDCPAEQECNVSTIPFQQETRSWDTGFLLNQDDLTVLVNSWHLDAQDSDARDSQDWDNVSFFTLLVTGCFNF